MPGTYQYDVEIKSNVAKLLSDMKQVQDRLDTVEGKEYKIKLNVDEKKLSSVISNLEKMLDSLGKGTGDFKQFENLSKELSSVVSEVQSLSKAFGKVDDSGTKTLLSSIQNIDKSLSEMSQNILNVNKNMSNMGGNTSGAVKQVENISNAYQDAAKEAEKLADAQSKIGQKTNISSGLDSNISKYQEIVSLVKEYYELSQKIQTPKLSYQKRSEDYDKIDAYLLSKKSSHNVVAGQIKNKYDREKSINDTYHDMSKGINEGKDFAVKAMKSAIQSYWANVTEMPSDDELLSSRKIDRSYKGSSKEEYIIPKKYQDMEKSVIQETMAMNKNNIAYEEERKQIEANNSALKERMDLIRNTIKSYDKNPDYNGEYRMGLSLKSSDKGKTDIFSSTSSISQEEMLQEICNMLGVEIPKNADKAKEAIKEVASATDSTEQRKDAFHSDIDTSSSVKSLENLEEEIKKIFTDANELRNILDSLHNGKYFHLSWTTDGIDETGADERVRQLSRLLKEYGYTINNFKSDSDAFDTSGVINAIKEENNVLEQNTQKIKENTQAKEQNANVNLNKYDKRLDSYNGKINKYKTTIDRFNDGGWTSDAYLKNVQAVKNAVDEYKTLLKELKGKDASLVTSEYISTLDNYEKKIKDTIATVTNMSAAEKGYDAVSGQKELDKIHKILNENTKMSAKAKAQIKAFYKEIEGGNPSMSLNKIHAEIMKIYNAEVEAGRAGKSMWSAIKEKAWYGMASAIGTYFGFNDIIQYGKEAFNVIKDLDTALVDLKKTTSMSATQLEDFYYDSNDVAKQMGVTTQEIIEQASAWSRLGYSSKEESTEMAKLSSQFASISPGMSTDESQEGLVSIMKAFDIDPDNVKSEIMDKVNTLGNNFAEDNQDVVEGLKRSAAAMSAMGQSFTDTAALFTGGMEILQDSESMGTALRTLSMRVRGYDEETNQLSDDLVNVTGEVADLTKTTKNAQGISLFTDASQEHYKSMVQYLGEIADEWNLISEKNQTELLQKLFGKNRANAGAAIIQNFDQVRAAIEAMDESAGSADKEMDTIENSLDYKLNALKETWVGIIQDMSDRGMLGDIINGLTSISNALGGLFNGLQQISSLDGNISSLGGTLGTIFGLVQSLTGHGENVLCPSL